MKEVLGMKHEKLRKIVGLKDVHVLRSNLLVLLNCETRPDAATILTSVQGGDSTTGVNPIENKQRKSSKRREQMSTTSSSSETESITKQSRGRKQKRDQLSQQPAKSTRIAFQFSRQGTWVAVAYDKGWYLGQVVVIQSCDKGSVQFLKHVRGCQYTWPSVEEVEEIEALHVFDSDIEVSTTNGRVWSVKQHSSIDVKYRHVKHLYR